MVQTPQINAQMRTVVELAHFQHAELTRLLQQQLVNLEAALQGALDPAGVASQDISEHRLPAIFQVAGHSSTSSEPLDLHRPGPPRSVHPVCIPLGESPGQSLEVGQFSQMDPSVESLQFFPNQSESERSMERSIDICISPKAEESGFSRNSFKERLVLPADASQKTVLEPEQKKQNPMESDDRPSAARQAKEPASPTSRASLSPVSGRRSSVASALEEEEQRLPHLRRWGYFRFIDGFRLLFQACQAFLPSLFWSMVLLAVFMFVAALSISHLLQGFIGDPSQVLEDRIWIWEHYGTAYRSAYTIYECTFAGNWPTYARPVLSKVSHWFSFFFMTYITLIAFALIRVITAVILKDTLDAAQSDAEHQVMERLQKKAKYVEKLEKVFTKLDESGEGLITEAHLNQMLLNPKIKAYLQTLDVDVHEGTALFHILDNGDGEVTQDEFINGILRCHGQARAIDQLAMHADVRQLTKKLLRLEKVLHPLGVVPSGSIPRSHGSRVSQGEYVKAFRVKSE